MAMIRPSASKVSAAMAPKTTNWYLAAFSGSPPAITWPAIMPGMVTMPLEASEAVVGNSPSRIDEMTDPAAQDANAVSAGADENEETQA